MSLFADQLMYEKKVTTAIKKTISLKTRGKIMGITQYLDPLNIAKMMTLGSSLGPALLGHWMKRDPRDIQYFTGRLKPIREKSTGDKITKLSRTGTGNIEGVSDVLRKMYKLLAGTHEENIKRLELSKNREEEYQIEEERRHKQLLEALGGGKNKKSKFAALGAGMGGLLKALWPILALMVNKAVGFAFKAYGWLKDLFKWLKEDVRFAKFLEKAKPFLKVGAAFELLTYSGDANAGSDKVPTNDPNAKENVLEPFSMVARGEAKTVYEAFQKIRQAKNNAPADRKEIIQATGGALTDVELKTLYGSTRKELFEWLNTHKDPNSVFQISKPSVSAVPENVTPAASAVTPSTTLPVSQTNNPTSGKLQEVQSENTLNRITKGNLVRQPTTTVNKNTVNSQKNEAVPLKRKVPSVRNDEDEFRNRMFENTVVPQ